MLVICCTPLQTLIAQRMLESERPDRFKLLYFTWIDNPKHRRYYALLAERASHSAFICLRGRFLAHWRAFTRAYAALRTHRETVIAFAAINNVYIQYALRRYRFARIVTFDDGITNLAPHGAYLAAARESPLRRAGARLIRGERDHAWVRRHTTRHYTIYPGLRNIVEAQRLAPLQLVTNAWRASGASSVRLRIFLGQPVSEFGDSRLTAHYRDIVDMLGVDRYLPHPRETDYGDIANVVESDQIAEDYVHECLCHYDEVMIMGFASAALLNLEHPRLKKGVIAYEGMPASLRMLHELFMRRNCELIWAPVPDAST